MYCKKCGKKVKENNNFCINCGYKLTEKNDTKGKADGKAVASLIIGILSILLSFSISIIAFPLELVGLILGLSSKTECSEKKTGIITNIIGMVISIVTFIIIIILIILRLKYAFDSESQKDKYTNESANYSWDCGIYGETNVILNLQLNEDGSYVWSSYDDGENNAVYGNYGTSKIDNNNYTLILNSESIIIDGYLENYQYKSTYNVHFSDNNDDNFLLESMDNNSKYYCIISDN